MPLGCVHVNSMQQLQPVGQSALRNERDELRPELAESYGSSASLRAFNLDSSCESGRVLLVLGSGSVSSSRRTSEVWFQDGSCALSRLAPSFAQYMRLSVLHLGLPRWQYAYTEAGLDPTCRQWLRLMAPDRLSISSSGGGSQAALRSNGSSCGLWAGGGSVERKPQPVRTCWVASPPPTHTTALRLLSISSLQQQQQTSGAHSAANSSRASSAAGAPRSAVALLSGGGGGGGARSCSRTSSATSTASSGSSVANAATASHTSRPASAARPTGGSGGLRGAAEAAKRRPGSAARKPSSRGRSEAREPQADERDE